MFLLAKNQCKAALHLKTGEVDECILTILIARVVIIEGIFNVPDVLFCLLRHRKEEDAKLKPGFELFWVDEIEFHFFEEASIEYLKGGRHPLCFSVVKLPPLLLFIGVVELL